MTDFAWFPSAAMQTLGAMYAIFAALYIFVVSRNLELSAGTFSEKLEKMRPHIIFIFLSLFVFFAISANAWVLYNVSIDNPPYSSSAYVGCFLLFLLALFNIVLYAIILVYGLAKK